jgi:hypothetical protein
MKTHFKKLKNTEFLGSWDLIDDKGQTRNIVATIKEIKKQMVHDGKGGQSECIVLFFNEFKPMIVNATNLKVTSKIMDSNYIEDWIGKKIEISTEKVRAFGEMHDALRIVKTSLDLTPSHPKWNGAKEAIKSQKVTIEQIKKQFSISTENEQLLCN